MPKTWIARVQENYTSLDEFETYCGAYGLAERCGYDSVQKLWDDNPLIGGSVNPDDFGIVKIDSVLKSVMDNYMEAIYFTEEFIGEDEGTIRSDDEFSPVAMARIYNDCKTALSHARELNFEITVDNAPAFGHDLWLTRNGHGAGFWDGDWEDSFGRKMSEYCQTVREVNVYSENGIIDFE